MKHPPLVMTYINPANFNDAPSFAQTVRAHNLTSQVSYLGTITPLRVHGLSP